LLFGLANGLVTIVRGALVPEYFGRSHIGRIGGAMSAVGLLARAAAPLISAWMLLFMTGYTQVLLALSALGFAAVAAFALARPPQRQR
jgi:MFS family permease